MNQEISKELIEKYLSGDDLAKEELALVEKALSDSGSSLSNKMAAMTSDGEWAAPLLGGIRYAGEQNLKKKLTQLADSLQQEGLLLDEDDITAWHKGRLSEAKTAIFQKRMAEDAQFAKVVANEKNLTDSLSQYGEKQLKSKIESARQSLQSEGFFEDTAALQQRGIGKIVHLGNRRKWLAIAAAAAVLLSAAIWLFLQRQPDAGNLFADNYQVYQDKISESIRSQLDEPGYAGNPVETEKWQEFLGAMKGYPNEVTALEAFIKKYPQEKIAHFYLGQAQLAKGQFELAQSNMEPLAHDADFEEQWPSKWYLALIYLKLGKLGPAKGLLDELKNSPTDFQSKAQKLYDQLY